MNMEMRFTNLVLKNLLSVLAILAALVAGIFAVQATAINDLLLSNCSFGQFWCVLGIDALLLTALLGMMFLVVFTPPVLIDLIFAFVKFLKTRINNYRNDSFAVRCKAKLQHNDGNKTEVYIEFRNKEWFIDAINIFVHCHFLYKGEVIQAPIKWKERFDKNGATFLPRRKRKLLHLATVDKRKKEYYLHLLDRDLVFPFHENGRAIEMWAGGTTSSNKPTKMKIDHHFVVSEVISDTEVNFKVFHQW